MEKIKLEELIEEGLSQRQIVERLGVPQSTLRWWLNKHHLKTRHNRYNRKDEHSQYKCVCGENNKDNFFPSKKFICKVCHSRYTKNLYTGKKIRAVEFLGGKCLCCGYNKCMASLDFHHVDSSEKQAEGSNMRHWSWERILGELKKCVLVCRNCHGEIHAGVTKITHEQYVGSNSLAVQGR